MIHRMVFLWIPWQHFFQVRDFYLFPLEFYVPLVVQKIGFMEQQELGDELIPD